MIRFSTVCRVFFLSACLSGGWIHTTAQDFMVGQSERIPTAPDPAELGYVESANGQLHLEIRLGSFPQRGGSAPLVYRLIYDSYEWGIVPNNFGVGVWTPAMSGGWHQVPYLHAAVDSPGFSSSQNACGAYTYTNFHWTDEAWVTHYFPVTTVKANGTCGTDTPSGDAFATDATGYRLFVTNYEDGVIFAPDGTQVVTGWIQDAAGNHPLFIDSNGNYISQFNQGILAGNQQTVDTIGRSFPQTSGLWPTVLTSQGTNQRYTITSASINVKTAFGQSGVTECTSNCSMSVTQDINLPDGTSYSFKYDCDSTTGNPACGSPGGQNAYYGDLMSVTLPSGGTINYIYTTFTDPYGNRSRWLAQKTRGSSAWYYTPEVLSTCTPNTVGCQQQVTVTKPSGDAVVFTFTLNNGAWPTHVQYYDAASNTFPIDVVSTFDFSTPCPLTNCFGASYVKKMQEVVTVPAPGGTASKKTALYYDGPRTSNIIQLLEWNYTRGTFASFPDRSKFITYLNTGTNNINRPTKITVCNNDTSTGTDNDCLGLGHRVSQTIIGYDSYGSNTCRGGAGLASITGVVNHDDQNFGPSNIARGNPTQIQKWVSGTTYLTTSLFYDTTGQVIQVSDPAGNVTCYDYTDNYYNDNGQSPAEAFAPAIATDAYITAITRPLIGKETYGYYYGSGKLAVSTDQNGQSTYSHYADALDRPTGTTLPVGWTLSTYSSATQIDSYENVNDASPSPACGSCRHYQTAFDGWGRKVSQRLRNSPLGATTIDTGYDPNDHVASVSHPYVNISDPTNVPESFIYDALDRLTQTTHPDQQASQTIYDPATITASGGLSSQQGSTATYGVGVPVLLIDEAGVQKQEWLDGFGRVIEVDESGDSFAGMNASGQVSVNGSVRVASGVGATPAQPGTGSLTIQGGERSVVDSSDCNLINHIWVCTTIYDSGSVTLTVNGVPERCSYNRTTNTNATAMASCLAGLLNTDTASPVTATASSGTISMTARTGGASTNYAFSVTSSWDTFDFGNTAAYTGNPASGTLSGGADAYGGTTVYDFGTVSLSVGGFTGQPVGYGSTVTVDVRFTNDSCSACSGTAVGGGDRNLFVNSIAVGSTTILPGDPSVTYVGAPCNGTSNGIGSLFCNGDMIATTSASGQSITVSAYGSPDYSIYPTMQLLVDGVVVGQWTVTGSSQNYTVTIPTGITTADQVASALAATMNVSGSPVTASASGSVITITYNTVGSTGNTAASVNSTPDDPSLFPGGSFSGNTTLAGGQDPSPGSLARPYVTLYAYDAADNLTGVFQGVQSRLFAYDGLSRITSQTTPEAGTDTLSYFTSSGAICSGDPQEACQRTDARGNVTTFQYDALNRMTQKANSTSTVQFFYDAGGAPAFAFGRLTSMADGSGSETYTYDKMGHIIKLQKVIGTATYTTQYEYDGDGNVTKLTYPSGRVVQMSYNSIGQLCEVAPSTTGCNSATTPYSTGYVYDAAGHLIGFDYGNGISAAFSYEPQRQQLSSIAYRKGTQTLFNLSYFYHTDSVNCPGGTSGNVGLIDCIKDLVEPGRSTSYSYEPLQRLRSAVSAGSSNYPQWGLTESYDRFGNRSSQTVTAGTAPGFSVAFDSATNRPSGYTYDLSGNLTVEPLTPPNSYAYDSDNRMTSSSGSGGTVSYGYDGHDFRVSKSVQAGTSTVYIYSGNEVIAEYDNGAAVTAPIREYVYAPGLSETRLLATISSGITVFDHGDHLSNRLLTDSSGQVIGEQGHFPFGEAWYKRNSTTKWFFTTYERDAETDLDYAISRYYNNRVAAFCSADPIGGDVNDPQSWNRYVYARDNPVNITDPDGRFIEFLIALIDFLHALFSHHDYGSTFTSGNSPEGDPGLVPFLPALFDAFDFAGKKSKTEMRPIPKPCLGSVLILKGNPKHINNRQGALEPEKIERDSAAVDPRQYGYPNGPAMKGTNDEISGFGTASAQVGKKTITVNFKFGNVRDVIGARSKDMPSDALKGENIKDYYNRKFPNMAHIELPGLDRGQFKGVGTGTIMVPPGVPCPPGTQAPAPPKPPASPIP